MSKALLMILDGWGIGHKDTADAIHCTSTPHWDKLLQTYPNSQLQASGENVGLPDGQMGNSEVGHLNIGAGRVVYQDLVKINRACKDGSILENPEIKAVFSYAKENGKKIHFMGLTSDGGVHSSLEHLFYLCDIAAKYELVRVSDSLTSSRHIARNRPVRSLLSAVVSMPWTVTNAGSA